MLERERERERERESRKRKVMKAMKISTTAATATATATITITVPRTNGIIVFLLNRNYFLLFFPRINYYHNYLHSLSPLFLVLSFSLSLSYPQPPLPNPSLLPSSPHLYWVLHNIGKVFVFVFFFFLLNLFGCRESKRKDEGN